MASHDGEVSVTELGPEDDLEQVVKDECAPELLPSEEDHGSLSVIHLRRSMLENSDDEEEEGDQEEEEASCDDDDEDDDDIDETLLERLAGLTEMFPQPVINGAYTMTEKSVSAAKWAYQSTRSIVWITCSTFMVLILPVIIETERFSIDLAEKQQQRQILLGPGAAMSSGMNAPLPI